MSGGYPEIPEVGECRVREIREERPEAGAKSGLAHVDRKGEGVERDGREMKRERNNCIDLNHYTFLHVK